MAEQAEKFSVGSGGWIRLDARYVPRYLKNWLAYFAPQNVFVYIVEESLFPSMPEVAYELICVVGGAPCETEKNFGREEHTNSESRGKSPMWNSTRKLLAEFYAPYNRELELLLGRKVNWD